ncbi:MAG: mechanosensitive ion channel family protein [Acidimicrobiales bacterium]
MSFTTAVPVLGQLSPGTAEACGTEPSRICSLVWETTSNKTFATLSDFLLAKPLKILLIVVLAMLVNRLARRAIRRFVQSFDDPAAGKRTIERLRERTPAALLSTGPVNMRSGQRARTIGAVLRSLTTAVVWTITVLMVLSEFNVNLGPLIAGAGIVGVALGFGAQSLVKDFLSGIFMLLEDQFGVGDIIDCGEAAGVVEGVSLRTTRLRDVEGTVWHVPNGQIARVGNKSQEWSRALLDVEVAYDTDLAQAKQVIKQVADDLWRDETYRVSVIDEPEMWGVERFGADGIAIRLVVKTRPADQWKVLRELRQRLKLALDDAGIEIPFPQRTVWVRPSGAMLPDGGQVDGEQADGGQATVGSGAEPDQAGAERSGSDRSTT